MTIRERIRNNLDKIVLGTVVTVVIAGAGVIGYRHLVKGNSYGPDQKTPTQSVSDISTRDSSNDEADSKNIRAVVLRTDPNEIMDQLTENDYVLKVREHIGRIRYLVILDTTDKTKQELRREIKPGYTIEFPVEAIGYETPFSTGKDHMDYTRIGYKYANRIRVVSKWTPLPEGHFKKHTMRYLRIRLRDITR